MFCFLLEVFSSTAPYQQHQYEKFQLFSNCGPTVVPLSRECQEIDHTLEIGSMVEVSSKDKLLYGVIRWMCKHEKLGWIVGLEMVSFFLCGGG